MPGYLPLCASRQNLLPSACRSCVWWQTSVNGQRHTVDAAERRRQWMLSVEAAWGSPGLLLDRGNGSSSFHPRSIDAPGNDGRIRDPSENLPLFASIHYAPAVAVPRLSGLPVALPDQDAVIVFCLRCDEEWARTQARRLLQKALGQLKNRGVHGVYGFASPAGSPEDQSRCQFFSLGFLESNGFQQIAERDDLYLMRADLRGLLALLGQVESLAKRVIAHDPTPSPAAWTQRGTS